MISQKDNDPL